MGASRRKVGMVDVGGLKARCKLLRDNLSVEDLLQKRRREEKARPASAPWKEFFVSSRLRFF